MKIERSTIAAGESQTLEFKSSFDKAAIESLVAFANAQGGTVLVGVSDNGAVQGVSLGKETLNEWLGQIKSSTSPSIIPDLSAHTLDSKTIVAIEIAEFPVNPVSTKGRYYKHVASSIKTPSMIIDDRQITDTLFEAVEQAMRFIVSHINVAFEIDGSIHRKERFAYPLPALREALLNSVVHRDYKDGSDIQVKIFDDRISIFSPGGPYAGLQLDEIQRDNYRSRLRNKLVAEGFYLTTAIEKYGSGFIRIREALRDYPEIQLVLEEVSGGLSVTFVRQSAKGDETHGGVSGGASGGVNDPNDLLTIIPSQPGLKTTDLARVTDTPRRTIERWLQQLKATDQIEFRGAPNTGGCHAKP